VIRRGCDLFVVLAGTLSTVVSVASGALDVTIENISSTHSGSPHVDNGSIGGRVNKLSGFAPSSQAVFAASEWSGLFRSEDGGAHWRTVPGYLPRVTSGVVISSDNRNRIIATSLYDGRVTSMSGIAVSSNGGVSWSIVDWAKLTNDVVCDTDVKVSPAGVGLSIDPASPRRIVAGTNCGVAVSEDGGIGWRLRTPDTTRPPGMVWDVLARAGVIYGCGDDGFFRLDPGKSEWVYPDPKSGDIPPQGRCSLAASPAELNVIYETVGEHVFESLDGGANWVDYGQPEKGSGRIPFVATALSGSGQFQLWYGDAGLFRRDCTDATDTSAARITRCFQGAPSPTPWTDGLGVPLGAHDDVGDIAFDTTVGATACPRLFSSDGGIYINGNSAPPGCVTPRWVPPDASPPTLWMMALAGVHPHGKSAPLLYTGAQDNGLTAGAVDASGHFIWTNLTCCDAFDVVSIGSGAKIAFTVCCHVNAAGDWDTSLYVADATGRGSREISKPPGLLPKWIGRPAIVSLADRGLVALTDQGVFTTADATADSVKWSAVGVPTKKEACTVQLASSGAQVTIFVLTGKCSGAGEDVLWQYSKLAGSWAGKWLPVSPPGGSGGIGVFGVDPLNPARVIVSRIKGSNVGMYRSDDGGRTWIPIADLDSLMTGNGRLRYYAAGGRNDWGMFDGYAQPRLVSYDPLNDHLVVAGGVDGGLFLSSDSGLSWRSLTQAVGPDANPEIIRPLAAYFDGTDRRADIYVTTQGSGIWRVSGIQVP
jgi:hypothetical protein